MVRNFLAGLIASAASLLIISRFLPGFHIASIGTAFLAAIVIGLVNGTLGVVIKFLMFPWRLLTLGLVSLFINAGLLMLSTKIVDGFSVDGFTTAFIGSIALGICSWVLGMILRPIFAKDEPEQTRAQRA